MATDASVTVENFDSDLYMVVSAIERIVGFDTDTAKVAVCHLANVADTIAKTTPKVIVITIEEVDDDEEIEPATPAKPLEEESFQEYVDEETGS